MKKIISNLLFGVVIAVCGYLIVANITQIIYANEYEVFDENNKSLLKDMNTEIKTLEQKVIEVKKVKIKGLSDEKMNEIKTSADNILNNIKSDEFLTYNTNDKITRNDFYNIYSNSKLNYMDQHNILNILSEHFPEIENFKKTYRTIAFNNSVQNTDVNINCPYCYRLNNPLTVYINPNNYQILKNITNLTEYTTATNYILDLVLEAGDTNE